ncbi:MAG: hypothetical protein FP831_02475 [Anaerolineae bacterium]|nr:hypothetical protein [Anaerolineae bacterium]
MKDLLYEPPAIYEKERSLLAQNGWCAQLLGFQDEDGLWNKSLYNGKWLSTTYSLYLLKLLGLSPQNQQALKGCKQLIAQGNYQDREIRFSRSQNSQDLGVSAIVLSLCCYFGYEADIIPNLALFLADHQTDGGNWLPYASPSAEDYTFETTLLVLEALMQFQNHSPAEENHRLTEAVQKGQDFLLRNNLGLRENKPIKNQWSTFSFPSYWFYDILTAVDYFCTFRTNKNKRIQMAVDLILHKATDNGRWLLGSHHPGKTYFEMEKPGSVSRWNTLRTLRIMSWWDGSKTRR